MSFSKRSNWCNAMDIQETELGLRCTVLLEGKDFSGLFNPGSLRAMLSTSIHTAGVSLPLSPGWPELRKQHDFESCWVLTLPEDARCSCILQLFTFIYNAWPRVQYSSLRVHRHMHNLPTISWKQTSHSTSTSGGGMCFVRTSCWWQFCWQQALQWFLEKKKVSVWEWLKFKFSPYIHHRDKNIQNRVITIIQNQSQNDLYSAQTHKGPVFRCGMTIFLLSVCHVSFRFSLTEF